MSVEELSARFQPAQILKTDTQTKSIVILGTIDGENAIVTLEKTAFAVSNLGDARLDALVNGIQLINSNDVYFWSLANLVQDLDSSPGAKVNFIYPASETHIKKYATQKYHMVVETAQIYQEVVKPFIDTQKGDRIQWVYNILFKGKESESFVHHETHPQDGFVLLPDMKWDQKTMDALYLVTIINRTDISSVRDINGSHVEFLETLSKKIKKVASVKYPVAADSLRLFVHYQPSYYHFHIHVVNVAHPGLGDGLNVGKAILLDDVIENVKMFPDYYPKKNHVLPAR
ncbi:hypothetical protein JCM33374_g3403 [Metschnikowia sp. JCM 33374]|nr:hypothetical protein JCM33374_g3403 [Metschnikowia sp. JCM 33374]